jgi:hypothetical protein
MDAANITRRHFAKLLTAAGLAHMRLYDLPLSCASLLADRGVDPKVIQQRMGHASIAMTYDIYIHAHPDGEARATEDTQPRTRRRVVNVGAHLARNGQDHQTGPAVQIAVRSNVAPVAQLDRATAF